jgi:hypothetical protein
LPTTLFPAGLLPEGELVQRNLKYEYSKAWDEYEKGNPAAINEFFEEHPEYQARLALFDEPEERLRQFLVSEIWDKWFELEDKNKPLVVDQLGEDFEIMFLDKETQDYTAIDNETLAYWAQMLGGYVPETEETANISNMPLYQQEGLRLYDPNVLRQVEEFERTRDELFPNWEFLQDTYYLLSEKDRKGWAKQNKELTDYWDWKDEYYEDHPDVGAYMDEQKKRYEENNDIYFNTLTQKYADPETASAKAIAETMLPALQMQLLLAYYANGEITGGARAMLMDTWRNMGLPTGDFDKWVSLILQELVQ